MKRIFLFLSILMSGILTAQIGSNPATHENGVVIKGSATLDYDVPNGVSEGFTPDSILVKDSDGTLRKVYNLFRYRTSNDVNHMPNNQYSGVIDYDDFFTASNYGQLVGWFNQNSVSNAPANEHQMAILSGASGSEWGALVLGNGSNSLYSTTEGGGGALNWKEYAGIDYVNELTGTKYPLGYINKTDDFQGAFGGDIATQEGNWAGGILGTATGLPDGGSHWAWQLGGDFSFSGFRLIGAAQNDDALYYQRRTPGSGSWNEPMYRVASRPWVSDQIATMFNAQENSIKRVDIDLADASNTRNDQSSMIELDDGRLVVAYSHFGASPSDTSTSEIWHSFSEDGGKTWNTPTQLISTVSIGTYIPSLYKKLNGNILIVFFVRETISPHTSSLRAIEYSADMTSVVTPMYTIYDETEYNPIASDRLFYDKTTDRLLMPYDVLVSGTGTSYSSVVTSGILISTDEGATWSDSGLVIDGKLDINGFGGAIEPGIFQNEENLTCYFRTLVGSVYAVDLTVDGASYIATDSYNLNVPSQNAMSSVKYIDDLKQYVAVYTKLVDDPLGPREILEMATSLDGLKWQPIATIDRSVSPLQVNEPVIFETDKSIVVSYSIQDVAGEWSIKSVIYPKEFLSGSGVQKTKRTSNPQSGSEANQQQGYTYDFSTYDDNVYGNIRRSNINVTGNISLNSSQSFYNKIEYLTIKGETGADVINVSEGGVFSNLSPQTLIDNIHLDEYFEFKVGTPSNNSLINGATIDVYKAISILEPNIPQPNVGEIFGIHQKGDITKNFFEGRVGIGTESPFKKLHLKGDFAMEGNGTGALNSTLIHFYDEALLSQGYLGFASTGNSNFFLRNNISGTHIFLDENGGENGLRYNNGSTNEIVHTTGNLKASTTPVAFASLPASPTTGQLATINDASSISYRGVASGGGSDAALVMWDGTQWIYH